MHAKGPVPGRQCSRILCEHTRVECVNKNVLYVFVRCRPRPTMSLRFNGASQRCSPALRRVSSRAQTLLSRPNLASHMTAFARRCIRVFTADDLCVHTVEYHKKRKTKKNEHTHIFCSDRLMRFFSFSLLNFVAVRSKRQRRRHVSIAIIKC